MGSTDQTSSSAATPEQRLTPAAWKYLWLDQGLIAIGVNFAINAAIAWSATQGMKTVPLHGTVSLVEDTRGTCFFLPFIACLVVMHLTRMEITKGRIPALPPFAWTRRLGPYFASSAFAPALLFGALGVTGVAPLAVAAIESTGIQELPVRQFLIFKGSFASVLGVIVCPLFAWLAMHTSTSAQTRNPRRGTGRR
jgi:hypothetical protein